MGLITAYEPGDVVLIQATVEEIQIDLDGIVYTLYAKDLNDEGHKIQIYEEAIKAPAEIVGGAICKQPSA